MLAATTTATVKATNCERGCTSGTCFRLRAFGSAENSTPPCYNWWGKLFAMRKQITLAGIVGLGTGAFCWFLLKHMHQGAGDFQWALHLAERLGARQNPYDTPL